MTGVAEVMPGKHAHSRTRAGCETEATQEAAARPAARWRRLEAGTAATGAIPAAPMGGPTAMRWRRLAAVTPLAQVSSLRVTATLEAGVLAAWRVVVSDHAGREASALGVAVLLDVRTGAAVITKLTLILEDCRATTWGLLRMRTRIS